MAGLRKMRHRGLLKVDWQFTLAMVAYDLVRLPKLLAAVAPSGTTDISPRAIARPRPIRPTAKPAARLIAHYPGSQSALNSAFFSALLVRTLTTFSLKLLKRPDIRRLCGHVMQTDFD